MKQIASPGWMHETSARGWCTGMTQRVGMGTEVGGDSGWGTHVNPWLIHVNVWQKPLQYFKVISLQLIKIIGEGEKRHLQKKNLGIVLGFLCGSADKESACNAGDPAPIPGSGRSPGEGNGNPLQYSGLENSMDCVVHGVTESVTTE